MGVKPDHRYNGTVQPGGCLVSMGTGTLAFQVPLECEDGPIDHFIWLTKKNHERAVKDFETLGIGEEQLRDQNFLEYSVSAQIEGREVCFGTKKDEYQGRTKVKVAWIGKRSAAADGNLARAAATFFGAKPTDNPKGDRSRPEIDDDDIPF